MNAVRVAVIGVGSMGKRYANWLSADGHEVAVVDTNADHAKEVAREIGGTALRTLEDVLRFRPQAAVIATPPQTHAEWAIPVLNAGVHALIEKPLAHTLEAGQLIAEAAASSSALASVVCNMRFHDGPSAIRERIEDIGHPLCALGRFGHRLEQMRPARSLGSVYASSRETGGGVVLDCIHEIDLQTWLFGPSTVHASSVANVDHGNMSGEDHAVICLKHDSGPSSTLWLDFLQRQKYRAWEVTGREGTLSWESWGKAPERCVVVLKKVGDTEILLDTAEVDGAACYRRMLTAFFAVVESDKLHDRLQTVPQALHNLELAIAALSDGRAPS